MPHSHVQDHTEHDLAKLIAVTSYLTLIGWLIAVLMYGKHRSALARFHIRQSLGLIGTMAILSFVPIIGWLLNIALLVFWLIAAYCAYKGECYPVPVVGSWYQEYLDFVV